jgi:glycosyltransferase involved in cell wall biosynthesis
LATFARCHREKGHRTLLKAVRELHADGFPLRWLIVGDGPDRPALSREVVAAGLGDIVSFAGWRTDTVDIMAATDVVVQPTLGEAFSQVMVEAMAMRRALVISDVGGVRDVVEDGVSGIVVPPGEPGPLAAALTQLASPDRRFELGRRAGARVRSELDIRVVVRQFERMYESVTRDPI